jgi:hypothetical protein
MNDEEMILDGPEGQEGGSVDVMERKERCWMRFLKGMVTDRNIVELLGGLDPLCRGHIV